MLNVVQVVVFHLLIFFFTSDPSQICQCTLEIPGHLSSSFSSCSPQHPPPIFLSTNLSWACKSSPLIKSHPCAILLQGHPIFHTPVTMFKTLPTALITTASHFFPHQNQSILPNMNLSYVPPNPCDSSCPSTTASFCCQLCPAHFR